MVCVELGGVSLLLTGLFKLLLNDGGWYLFGLLGTLVVVMDDVIDGNRLLDRLETQNLCFKLPD